MKRIIASLLGVVMTIPTVFFAPTTAIAGGGGINQWAWTDISNQLTTRTNRPVWAVAYGNGSWFYTDGLDLWNNGQVYRYDGFTQVNITTDIRNAGLSRVDDIVSDGNTILFLQDVVRQDNQLKIVAYHNGNYLNITSRVRDQLGTNEGVSEIRGRNGEWRALTTEGRLLALNTNAFSVRVIAFPSNLQNLVNTERNTNTFRVRSVYTPKNDNAFSPMDIQPINGSEWLLRVGYDEHSYCQNGNCGTTYSHKWYRISTNDTFTEVTNQLPTDRHASIMASNGQTVLVFASNLTNGTLYEYNGVASPQSIAFPTDAWHATDVAWNGKSWMIVENPFNGTYKMVYRYDPVNRTIVGEATRDYFTSAAGDTNGRFLLGGAVSDVYSKNPHTPLTAKLTMVTEGVAAPRVLGTTTSVGGPTINVNGNPSDFRVGNGREFAYRIDASDPDGVSRIDLYVNNALIRTCLSETSCEYRTIYWTNGDPTRTVAFRARATDRFGNVTEGRTDFLTVDTNSNAGAGGQVQGITDTSPVVNTLLIAPTVSIWTWLEPNQTTLSANQSVRFRVGANDTNGLNRIEIVANGSTVRTCNFGNAAGNRECDWTLFANSYTPGSEIFVNAKATGPYGYVWSNSTTFFRAHDNGTTPPPVVPLPPTTGNQKNPAVWDWLQPNDEILERASDFTDYRMGAWDEDGLDRIEMVVNGTVRRTCNFNVAFGNRECTWRIHASDYTPGSEVFVNAKATDRFGNVSWTGGKTVRITGTAGDNPQNTLTISADKTTYAFGDHVRFTATAGSAASVDRLEILVNGVKLKTCFGGARTCSVTIGPLHGNQTFRYAATLVTPNGTAITTGQQYVTRQ